MLGPVRGVEEDRGEEKRAMDLAVGREQTKEET